MWLEKINQPSDLKLLSPCQLSKLAAEIREFMLQSLNKTGGHLASNLGVVELTLALFYVFDLPKDQIIWDVGHQSYTHKILSDRKNVFSTLRQYDGISGFPLRSESVFDSFGVGHSSTSISAALGMVKANQILHNDSKIIAVIGDGAMTAGMAFEALNNISKNDDILVILNDNEMSISNPVGALNSILTRITSGNTFNAFKNLSRQFLEFAPPPFLEIAKTAEEQVKNFKNLLSSPKGNLFEEFGFKYYGVIDGHNLDDLINTLKNLKDIKAPKFLHIATKKGKGFFPAEQNPIKYHGVSKGFLDFSENSTRNQNNFLEKNSPKTFTDVFSHWLCDAGEQNSKMVCITPAMCVGSGIVDFAKRFPQRFFDVGIAEQHAVTFAAGLSTQGIIPVVAIYSTFLQRAYDQLIHDVALQNLPVIFAVDRSGLVGEDGATHAGMFDISFCRCIPNVKIFAPADGVECYQMLQFAIQNLQTNKDFVSPIIIRYSKRKIVDSNEFLENINNKNLAEVNYLKAEIKRDFQHKNSDSKCKNIILALGDLLYTALQIADEVDAMVVNLRCAKPIDFESIEKIIQNLVENISNGSSDAKFDINIITLEDNVIKGGVGEEITTFIQQKFNSNAQNSNKISKAKNIKVYNLGIPDKFIEHGEHNLLYKHINLDAQSILSFIKNL